MKKIKKIVTLLTIGTLSLSLVACSQSEDNNTSVKTTQENVNSKVDSNEVDKKIDKDEVIKEDKEEPKDEAIALGEKYADENYELTIKDYEFLDLIKPEDPSGYYTYYEVENDGEQYLKINMTFKNLGGETMDLSDIGFKVTINDKYNYSLQSTYENNGTFEITPYVKSLQEVNGVIFGAIPKEAIEQIETMQLFFGYNDDYDNMFDSLESKDHIIEFKLQ